VCIAVCRNSAVHRYRKLKCHMGSHSVTCHPTEVRIPPLPPAEAGTRFGDPGGMQGRVNLRYVKEDRPGIEPRPASRKSNPMPFHSAITTPRFTVWPLLSVWPGYLACLLVTTGVAVLQWSSAAWMGLHVGDAVGISASDHVIRACGKEEEAFSDAGVVTECEHGHIGGLWGDVRSFWLAAAVCDWGSTTCSWFNRTPAC